MTYIFFHLQVYIITIPKDDFDIERSKTKQENNGMNGIEAHGYRGSKKKKKKKREKNKRTRA